MKHTLASFKPLYIETARVYLNSLTNDINILQRNPRDRHMLNNCYISAHSLKSQSAVMGFPHIEAICRILEKLFHDMKDGELATTSNILQSIGESIEILQNSVNKIEKEDNEDDTRTEVKKLEQINPQ